ncbi:DNA-binding response regulator [Kordiimonas sediminis]|uniref:DNA-binding response regulator n=1 Tax=Kordiimonas sediminis TaxID=1735581 RepID=A0A919AMY8_9PROT|nr:response regulator transcription factor [Kordiimonas sediminis]GHF13698.1 DNA-binding response regulator [Kordiimonas sediminis]
MRLLLVEDDPKLGPHLRKDLTKAGYAVDLTASATDGEYMGQEIDYDVVILDIGLPEKNGIEVLKTWRAAHLDTPVIILSARSSWEEKVTGFQAGADDYLAKPFHFEELTQRLNAILRRSHGPIKKLTSERGFSLDPESQELVLDTGAVHALTGTEFKLLRYLMMNPGKIHSKTALMERVYDHDSDKDSNVIEVYIRRLRQKLPEDSISTKRGQGYLLNG